MRRNKFKRLDTLIAAQKLKEDLDELAWWRKEFATRFFPGSCPKPGDRLYGYRLSVFISTTEGRWTAWDEVTR